MALKVGDRAPEFELESTGGNRVSLGELSGRSFVLYFYPKDFTPGCTKQACSFRDEFEHLRDLDVPVFGVSRDRLESHLSFKEKHGLPFELLSDVDGSVAKSYDARMPLIGVTKRITYLIDGDSKIIAVHDELFGNVSHVREVIKALG